MATMCVTTTATTTVAEWWLWTKMGVTATGQTSAKHMAIAASNVTALVNRDIIWAAFYNES